MASRSIKNRPSIKKKRPFVGLLAFLSIIAAICLAGCIGVVVLGDSWIGDLKTYEVSEVSELNTSAPTTVLASDEKTQLARFQVENREPVELSGISKYVMQGTVATEDERFYDHGGFDLVGHCPCRVRHAYGVWSRRRFNHYAAVRAQHGARRRDERYLA